MRYESMRKRSVLLATIGLSMVGCNSASEQNTVPSSERVTIENTDVQVVGAMRNVMWDGALGGVLNLDTIPVKEGLYGLGPVSYLTGELMIKNGTTYVSRATSDSTMSVTKQSDITAPFFVYTHVSEWEEIDLPTDIVTITDLEQYIDMRTEEHIRPFAFVLKGMVNSASIHIQNLPEGTEVSSPKEAHQGQVNFNLHEEEVEIVGFFSTEHQGVFTHHDSYLHMHLITVDEMQMGHLDKVKFASMKLYLPVQRAGGQ